LKTVAIYGASMSVSMYQSAILRLNKGKESVQKQIAAEQEKVGKLRRDAAKLREEAVKTKGAHDAVVEAPPGGVQGTRPGRRREALGSTAG
jgi:hypothetical protein